MFCTAQLLLFSPPAIASRLEKEKNMSLLRKLMDQQKLLVNFMSALRYRFSLQSFAYNHSHTPYICLHTRHDFFISFHFLIFLLSILLPFDTTEPCKCLSRTITSSVCTLHSIKFLLPLSPLPLVIYWVKAVGHFLVRGKQKGGHDVEPW